MPDQSPFQATRRFAALIALIILSLIHHYSAIAGWWLSDDPQVLVQAVRHSPRQYFFVPEVWRYLSASNFTPLVTLSFEADLALVGLEPRLFYVHQVIALTVAAVLLFVVLSRYAGIAAAFAAAAFFVVSPQAIVGARTLMVRHYVEGLVLALLSFLFWVRGRESRTFGRAVGLSIASAVFYLLAILAKEVYVPLPLLMIFESSVARERWRRIAARGVPIAASLAGYLSWRFAILGSVGGYGSNTASVPTDIFPRLWSIAIGPAPRLLSISLLAVLGLLMILAAWSRPWLTFGFVLTALGAGVGVLVPISGQLEMRHGMVIFVLIAAGVALTISVARWRLPAWLFAGVSLLLAAFAGQAVRRMHDSIAERVAAEGQYVWRAPAEGPVLLADSPGWYLGGLSELRRRSGRGNAPGYVLSPEGLAIEPIDLSRVVAPLNGRVGPLSAEQSAAILSDRRDYLADAPVELNVEKEGYEVRWQVGPEPAERFVFLTYPEYDEYVIPRSGSRVIPEATERQFFRLRRDLIDGRWTVTPPLPLPERNRSTRWERN